MHYGSSRQGDFYTESGTTALDSITIHFDLQFAILNSSFRHENVMFSFLFFFKSPHWDVLGTWKGQVHSGVARTLPTSVPLTPTPPCVLLGEVVTSMLHP